jgi:uncharacterized protein involved in exopolysaccharide biosynthesis
MEETTMNNTDQQGEPNSRTTKAIIIVAMVLAGITAVFGALAVYKAVFVYTIVPS